MSAREAVDALLFRALLLGLAALRLLPRRVARGLCRGFGVAWARLGGPRTDVAATNLAIAFPERAAAWRHGTLVDSFGALAEGLVDLAQLPVLDEASARRLVSFEGFEHIEAARAASPTGGAILLTAHFGPFELFGPACALRGIPVSIVHREQDFAPLERLLTRWRDGAGLEMLPRGSAARGVLRALRAGRMVGMTLDQDTPREEGVFVPFFGRPACTRSAPARLAMHVGVPVVPGFLFPRPDGSGHVARFEPALELQPAGDDPDAAVRENTARMTAAIERAVRAAPAQWAWQHRRWRTAPESGHNVYKPAKPLEKAAG